MGSGNNNNNNNNNRSNKSKGWNPVTENNPPQSKQRNSISNNRTLNGGGSGGSGIGSGSNNIYSSPELLRSPSTSPLVKKKTKTITPPPTTHHPTDRSIHSYNGHSECSSNSSDGTYVSCKESDVYNSSYHHLWNSSSFTDLPTKLHTKSSNKKNNRKSSSNNSNNNNNSAGSSATTSTELLDVCHQTAIEKVLVEHIENHNQPQQDLFSVCSNLNSSSSSSSSFLRVSLSEYVTLGLIILGFAAFSIMIGIAAGISISIHFHDSATFLATPAVLLLPPQRPPSMMIMTTTTSTSPTTTSFERMMESMGGGRGVNYYAAIQQERNYQQHNFYRYHQNTISPITMISTQHVTNLDPLISHITNSATSKSPYHQRIITSNTNPADVRDDGNMNNHYKTIQHTYTSPMIQTKGTPLPPGTSSSWNEIIYMSFVEESPALEPRTGRSDINNSTIVNNATHSTDDADSNTNNNETSVKSTVSSISNHTVNSNILMSSWNPCKVNDVRIPVFNPMDDPYDDDDDYDGVGGRYNIDAIYDEEEDDDDDEEEEEEEYSFFIPLPSRPSPPSLSSFWDWTSFPVTLCSDGHTMGYDTLVSLQGAIHEANYYSAERSFQWTEYYNQVQEYEDTISTFNYFNSDVNYEDEDNERSEHYDEVDSYDDSDVGDHIESSTTGNIFEDNALYYEEDFVFTICPGATLSVPKEKQRNDVNGGEYPASVMKMIGNDDSSAPIYVNAENVVIECDLCSFDISGSSSHEDLVESERKYKTKDRSGRVYSISKNVRDHDNDLNYGTHFSFGPSAKNVLIRGITFQGATTSSLTLYSDGADVTLEDCLFQKNTARYVNWGVIADINSTSTINFYRCYITKKLPSSGTTASSLSTGNGKNKRTSNNKNRNSCHNKKNCRNSQQHYQELDGTVPLSIRQP